MPKYMVQISPNSISYELEADSEKKAIEYAQECFSDESTYDILKWADYGVEEIGEEL